MFLCSVDGPYINVDFLIFIILSVYFQIPRDFVASLTFAPLRIYYA